MLRLTLLVGAIFGTSYIGDVITALDNYQGYIIAVLLAILLQPWIMGNLNRNSGIGTRF